MRRLVVGMIAITAIVNAALAQPLPGSELQGDPARPLPGAEPRIPVTMGDKTEVLAPEAATAQPPVMPPPVSLEQPIDPDAYVCGPGDVLELNFWGAQNFHLRLAVDLEGRAFVAKVGYIAVAGK